MLHVAILKPPYIRDILAGVKTIESRLTRTMQVPHGQVTVGERVFLKASGGPFMAMAVASRVEAWRDATPRVIGQIEARHREQIGGDDAYWQAKRQSRYATLIWLDQVEPIEVGPAYKIAYMKAWYVLDESLSPVWDFALTDGAIRNRYAYFPLASLQAANLPITLVLPDGHSVETRLVKGRQVRWRGWGHLYEQAKTKPGDRVRFVAIGGRRYRVSILPQTHA
ncbi:MAG: ASCH domain-containing protein [Planctomycetota bacterium]